MWHDNPRAVRDLNTFDRHYGFARETARSFRKVNQYGKSGPLPSGDRRAGSEISLDLQAVRAVCRTCRLLLVEAVRGMKVGDPEDEATEMGPLISAAHRETVASFVEGEPLFVGDAPGGKGFWYPATLVEAREDDRIAREEVFGPVAALIPFRDEADALRIANESLYGLSGSIWTRDGAKALRMARAIDTGVLSINSNSSVRVSTPFGGFKQSGFGRELGMHAMDGYSELKNVFYSTE